MVCLLIETSVVQMYNYERAPSGDVRKNFSWSAFACRCCGRLFVAVSLVDVAQVIRVFLGRPLRVASAYRCPSHNSFVGGSDTSEHLRGLALDLSIPSYEDRAAVLEYLASLGYDKGGLEQYSWGLHLDLGANRRWS